jgi:archaellum component FlaF (FlaF/FlaG flagellin family)
MFHYLRVVLTLIVVLALFDVPVSAQDPEPVPPQEARIRDATEYTKAYGVELDEALQRLSLQDTIGDLNYQLRANEADSFAGLWIQHNPAFKVVVKFTGAGQKIISPYLENSLLAELVEVQTADVSLAMLETTQKEAMQRISLLDIRVDSSINIQTGVVELYVLDRDEFEESLQELDLQLPNHVEVIVVKHLLQPTSNIYGGLSWDNVVCTIGFSVQSYNRELGVTTAGHCGNTPPTPEIDFFYDSLLVPHRQTAFSGNADIQWHAALNHTVRSWIYDGSYNRPITQTKVRAYQTEGEWVCHYGRTTLYGCGNIISTSYIGTPPDSTWTYIVVDNPSNIDLSEPGDSGGPWFNGYTAYGTMVGQLGNWGVYMAINYIDALNVNVYTEKETYLPDVRNSNGWLSNITIRYTGTSGRAVSTIYLDNNGNYVNGSKDECFLGPNQSCTVTPPSGFNGSAIVDGSEDVSVVVVNERDSQSQRTSYTGILPGGSGGDIGWEEAGSTLYAPSSSVVITDVHRSSISSTREEGPPLPPSPTTMTTAFSGRGEVTR